MDMGWRAAGHDAGKGLKRSQPCSHYVVGYVSHIPTIQATFLSELACGHLSWAESQQRQQIADFWRLTNSLLLTGRASCHTDVVPQLDVLSGYVQIEGDNGRAAWILSGVADKFRGWGLKASAEYAEKLSRGFNVP